MYEIKDIKASTRLRDILGNFPELTDYFLEMGICGCEDENLDWTLERVAKERGKKLEIFLEEINKKIKSNSKA